ncbi:LysR family transcriptional regulator [Variovorax sp. M-6]|uniref:LysR family transcriptional regulator n=1 Tax=Variovorax sp. M-6 TaxID=3233041 RepID=UPI003F9BDEE8
MTYTLKHLQTLLYVARYGSFSVAAQKLRIARPGVSVLIRELEERLGFAIFERTTRSVVLTEDGRAFLPFAERVLDEYQASVWAARNMSRRDRSTLKIGSSQLMASVLMPDAIVAFNAQGLQCDIDLVDLQNDEVINAVVSGQVEIGVGPERQIPDAVSAQVLFSSPLGCLCAAEHPFALGKQASWHDMVNQTIISSDRGGALMVMHELDYEMRFSPAIEVRNAMSAIALVSRNLGVMIATSFVEPLLSPFNVQMIPLVEPVIHRRTMLYARADAQLTPEARAFSDVLLRMPVPASRQPVRRGKRSP